MSARDTQHETGPLLPKRGGHDMRLAPGVPRLARVRDGRVITGLCGGVAALTGYAPATVRVVFVLGAVLTLGTLVVAYLALSALVPAAQA